MFLHALVAARRPRHAARELRGIFREFNPAKNMNEGKLGHSIIGTAFAWVATWLSWTASHVGLFAGIAAIVASIYTARVAHETIKLRRAQRRKIETEAAEDEP